MARRSRDGGSRQSSTFREEPNESPTACTAMGDLPWGLLLDRDLDLRRHAVGGGDGDGGLALMPALHHALFADAGHLGLAALEGEGRLEARGVGDDHP